MRNPGRLIKLSDGRLVIMYNKQPLKDQKRIVLHLINENWEPVKNDNGAPATLVRTISEFNELVKDARVVGMID